MEDEHIDPTEGADKFTDLQEENDDLRDRFNKTNVKLFRDQITDTEIRERVQNLQDDILSWTKDIIKDLKKQGQDLRHSFRRVLNHKYPYTAFRRLGYRKKPNYDADLKWMRWLGGLDTCICFALSRQIWWYLHRNVFSRTYPIGISKEAKKVINKTSSILKSYDFEGKGGYGYADKEIIINQELDPTLEANKWRSQTVTALSKKKHSKHKERHFREKLSKRMISSLGLWVDKKLLKPHFKTLKDSIVYPSVRLHRRIARSPFEYLFDAPEAPGLLRGQVFNKSMLSTWTLHNVANWKPARDDIAGVFECLYPGIYRRGNLEEGIKLVMQPVILVYNNTTTEEHPPPPLQSPPNRRAKRNSRHDPRARRSTAAANRAPKLRRDKKITTTHRTRKPGVSFFMPRIPESVHLMGREVNKKEEPRSKTKSNTPSQHREKRKGHSSRRSKRTKRKSSRRNRRAEEDEEVEDNGTIDDNKVEGNAEEGSGVEGGEVDVDEAEGGTK